MDDFNLSKKVKELRARKGLSQELLANTSGLSLRTVQRIENGETVPRGDTLKRLAVALQVSPDEIIDWQVQEDKDVLTMLSLSQLGFLAFPVLGIIIPLAIWILKKDKIRYVDSIGKSILNFQISWAILLFFGYIIMAVGLSLSSVFLSLGAIILIVIYVANILIVLINTIKIHKGKIVHFKPAFGFLR